MSKARSGRTVVVKDRVYSIPMPKPPDCSGGLRLAPKPKDWAYCQRCRRICNRHNRSQHETLRHRGICPKCHQAVGNFCCITKCIDCKMNKPKNKNRRCDSCIEKRLQMKIVRRDKKRKIKAILRRIGTIRYSRITPEQIRLMKFGV